MNTSTSVQKLRAFTLVELLVVIGIIALLISILLPALSKARQQANITACLSNMRQIGQGIIMYTNDNSGTLPGPASKGQKPYYDNTPSRSVYLATFLAHYLGYPLPDSTLRLDKVFVCPAFPLDTDQADLHVTMTWQTYVPRAEINNINDPGFTPIYPFGLANVADPTKDIPPVKISKIKESSTAVALREIDALNTTTNTFSGAVDPSAAWSSGWKVLGYPLHGVSSGDAHRNVVYFDGHAATVTSRP